MCGRAAREKQILRVERRGETFEPLTCICGEQEVWSHSESPWVDGSLKSSSEVKNIKQKYIAGPGIKTLKFTLDKLSPELWAQLCAEVKNEHGLSCSDIGK